jgi:multidrug resistance efflux pump
MLDAFVIIFISLVTALLSEGASYVLIYRTDSYQKVKKTVDQLTAKVEKKKDGKDAAAIAGGKDNSSGAKKGAALEAQLKLAERDLSMTKMKGTMVRHAQRARPFAARSHRVFALLAR